MQVGEGHSRTREERIAGTVVDGPYLRASGKGDVVGQAPGVMYSK